MLFPKLLLFLLFASTWGMVGLIWIIQIVHYPLFARVQNDFTSYATEHVKRISWVVIPLMIVELSCSLGLLMFWHSFDSFEQTLLVMGLIMLTLVWGSTFFLQVPCHEKMARERDAQVIRRLVRTNWIRTLGWSIRGVLVFVLVFTFVG